MYTRYGSENYVDFNLIDDPSDNDLWNHRNIIRYATYARKRSTTKRSSPSRPPPK